MISRLLGILKDGNAAWLWHRLFLIFNPQYQHPSAIPYLQKQNLTPVVSSSQTSGPLKVLYFSHDLKREGAAISLLELVSGLQSEHGILPEVISFAEGPLEADYRALGVPVRQFPMRWDEMTTPKRLDAWVRKIVSLILESKPDLIFVNTLAAFPAVEAAHRAGIPSLWVLREGESGESFYRVIPYPAACRAIACSAIAHQTVFVSKASRNLWKDYESFGRFTVIPNALNLERFQISENLSDRSKLRQSLNLKENSIVFLLVGTLEARKGQLDLLQAFKLLPDEVRSKTEIAFLGSGNGAYAEQLFRESSRPVFENRIHFLSSREAARSIYEAADVFVLSSRRESYPRVILEAMSAGLPIITTSVGGVPEQVQENKNALFYKAFDSRELSSKMIRLIESRELRIRMAEESRRIISEMPDFKAMTNAYASLIRNALCGKKGSNREN